MRQELPSNGDFTATANRACEHPAITLRFVARQIAALSPQIRTCSKFSATLLRFYRSSCRAIKSLCVNEPLVGVGAKREPARRLEMVMLTIIATDDDEGDGNDW